MRKPALKSERAYTLIEILVGMTIIGLIFSIGYVSFRDFSRRQALAGVARDLRAVLRLIQERALAGEKPDDGKCNSPNTLVGYEFRRHNHEKYDIEANCSGGRVNLRREVELPEGYEISDFVPQTDPKNRILFKVLGQGTNLTASTTITITQVETGKTQIITVTPTGEIK